MNFSVGSFSGIEYEERVRYAYKTPLEKEEESKKKEMMGITDPIAQAQEKFRKKCDPNCECETCKRRKYVDGSDEMVSFKSPQHVSPQAAGARVRAHEQEHVSNAYKKAAVSDAKVVQCNVAIHTAVCPECGRTYVSGGTTTTQIKYYNEDNPYQQDLKLQDQTKYTGQNVDAQC